MKLLAVLSFVLVAAHVGAASNIVLDNATFHTLLFVAPRTSSTRSPWRSRSTGSGTSSCLRPFHVRVESPPGARRVLDVPPQDSRWAAQREFEAQTRRIYWENLQKCKLPVF